MKWSYLLTALGCLILVYILLEEPANVQQGTLPKVPAIETAPLKPLPAETSAPTSSNGFSGILASPFARGVSSDTVVNDVESRRRRMKQGGYSTPDRYHSLTTTDLVEMAKTGDVYAMLQLGDRYSYEDLDARTPGLSPYSGDKNIGKRYFIDAANAGHHEIVQVIIQMYAQEGNPVTAHAWRLVQERLGSASTKTVVPNLDSQQQQQAHLQANALWTALTLRLAQKN